MRIAVFDPIGGAAGDMILGALIGAGLSLQDLRRGLETLALARFDLHTVQVRKGGVDAVHLLVDTAPHRHERRSGISLREVEAAVGVCELPGPVQQRALATFGRLAEAEAAVSGRAIDDVRIEGDGPVDSMVDIVGTSIALDLLGVEAIYCTSFPLWSGVIETRHGTLRIPDPVTRQLIASSGAPTRADVAGGEQTTPTGAAILTTLARFGRPDIMIERTGCGAGTADLEIPNVIRVEIGELTGNLDARL